MDLLAGDGADLAAAVGHGDGQAAGNQAGAALLLKLEPQFAATTLHAELPTVESLGAQWEGYLSGQDLTGLDRDRLVRTGHAYLAQAIEDEGEEAQC